MAWKQKSVTEIYVPILNETVLKKLNHWNLGVINNDWHFYRNYNPHIQDLLLHYQQQAAAQYHFFDVLRFYAEDANLENNQHTESIILGLILQAFMTVSKSVMRYRMICATGDLVKAETGQLILKSVAGIEEKFDQFIKTLRAITYPGQAQICFACVTEKGAGEELKQHLEEKLLSSLQKEAAERISILVFEQEDRLEEMIPHLITRKKKKLYPIGIALLCLFLLTAIFLVTTWKAPVDLISDNMDEPDWNSLVDNIGSELQLETLQGRTNNALGISFSLVKDGWVLISKQVKPGALAGFKGLQFYYQGEGAGNSVEFKLELKDGTTFGIIKRNQSAAPGWQLFKNSFTQWECWWPDTNCTACARKLNIGNIANIHIAISNKEGDTPGRGKVLIDDFKSVTYFPFF